jgi:hypothetical protein
MKKLIFFSIIFPFFFSFSTVFAQWQHVGLTSIPIFTLALKGDTIIAGGGGIYLSSNMAGSWDTIYNGIPTWIPTYNTSIITLAVSGNNFFAGTSNGYGVYLSSNSGANWTAVNTGLPGPPQINALAVSDSNIFAGALNGIFISSNNGNSWDSANAGINALTNVRALAISGDTIFAGTGYNGIFMSSHNGNSWDSIGLPNSNIWALAKSGSNIFAGTWGYGIYRSTNNGITWDSVNTGLSGGGYNINAFAISGNKIFAGTEGEGVCLSLDNGSSWTPVNAGITGPQLDIDAFAIIGDTIFAADENNGVWMCPLKEIEGIKEINNNANNITVYPNPVTDNLQIQTDVPIKEIEITDITGRLLYTTTATKTINCSSFAKGVYFIKATTEKGIVVKKFVKE